MEILSLFASYFSESQTLFLGFLLGIIALYKYLIQPRLDKLTKLENEQEQQLANILTLDDLNKHKNENQNQVIETLYVKFSELQEQNTIDIKNFLRDLTQSSKENTNDILELLRSENKNQSTFNLDFLTKLEKLLVEHDDKSSNYDQSIVEIFKMINIIYEVLDVGFTQLESENIIKPFQRMNYKDFANSNRQVQLNSFYSLMEQMSKQKNLNSRLNQIFNN